MTFQIPNLCFPLPVIDLDPANRIETRSVSGLFGITAEVATFDEVLDWQEKRKALSQGYYRLIHPPRTQQLLAALQAHYTGWTPVLFASPQLALKEWAEFGRLEGETTLCSSDAALPPWCPVDLLAAAGVRTSSTGHLLLHAALPETLEASFQVVIGVLANPALGCEGGVLLMRDSDAAARLYERNRRRGGVLSGRVIAQLTGEHPETPTPDALDLVRGGLCRLEQADAGFTFVSGMQAITAVLDVARTPGRGHFAVLGHLYRDSHILLEEMKWDGEPVTASFLSEDALGELEQLLSTRQDVAAVFVETITNPLIQAPDLPAIIEIATRAKVPVIVDNTMATPVNCQPLLLGADIVIHSTSKYLSGTNQHGGGAVLTSDGDWIDRLERYQTAWHCQMAAAEASALLEGLKTFPERMERFEANGSAVRSFLRQHPAVGQVFPDSEALPAHLTGWGSVVSCLLRENDLQGLQRFFDAPLEGIRKAPSLGSDQTLFCPYILLTYFDKSDDYLRAYGLHRCLVRISVGSEEDVSGILSGLDDALRQSLPLGTDA